MKAITLRNIPVELAKKLEQEAAVNGDSLNKTAIRLLLKATGLAGPRRGGETRFRDLDHLAGTWSVKEAEEFEAALADQRRVDPELWD